MKRHSGLHLPSDIPGLRRLGTPVVCTERYWDGTSYHPGVEVGQRGVVAAVGPLEIAWLNEDGSVDAILDADPAHVGVDLEDATGRAHATWWLADRLGLIPGGPHQYMRVTWRYRGLWDLDGPLRRICFSSAHSSRSIIAVPGLMGLIRDNETRALSDDSRWVDAEALRLVCLHVAGRST